MSRASGHPATHRSPRIAGEQPLEESGKLNSRCITAVRPPRDLMEIFTGIEEFGQSREDQKTDA